MYHFSVFLSPNNAVLISRLLLVVMI